MTHLEFRLSATTLGMGSKGGTLRVTDDAVIIERGGGRNEIPIREIKAVFYKEPGARVGYIAFATEARDQDPGPIAVVTSSYMKGLPFASGSTKDARQARELIEARLASLGVDAGAVEARRERIFEKVKALRGGAGWLARGEIKELPGVLWSDEMPERITQGVYEKRNGLVVGTDRRLIFIDKGLASLRVEDFPYPRITSVQFKTGMLAGELEVYASGNRATITQVPKNEVREFAEWLRSRLAAAPTPFSAVPAPPATPAAADAIEQIERLARLRDQGVLTDEEFTAKKRQLLEL